MTDTPARWQRLREAFDEANSLTTEERQEFLSSLQFKENTIFDELSKLINVHTEAQEFLQEPLFLEAENSLVGETIGNYRIIREIGRGGMGVVFEAIRQDGEFEQKAAIKLTNHNLFSDELTKRFLAERQILAKLEHKNIVRLLDGGITSHHIPYFVMEYVEGIPITQFCAENELGINERLQLFLQVCDAVSYAHRQLIVHRDLKPSNILVTADGEVKLLDFGIAKILDSEAQTLTVNAPLTPEYASPEQIKGEIITTSSDIYSLGVILFELLTEKSPCEIYGVKRDELYRAVCENEPIQPSSVVSSQWSIVRNTNENKAETQNENPKSKITNPKLLKGDLDNIVLKSLQKEKDSRYLSVGQLADDIKSYLQGLPVKAHPQSYFYRAEKFFNRNRFGVIITTSLVLLILTATFIAFWQASVARQQRHVAEQNFNQVRKIANSLILDYHDEIEKLQGSTKLREKLVSDALNYLNTISTQETNNAELLKELAIAYRKVADVQGQPYNANLGLTADSLKNYEKSIELLEKAVKLEPTSIALKDELAISYKGEYQSKSRLEHIPAMAIQKILDLSEDLIKLDPDNLDRKISWLNFRLDVSGAYEKNPLIALADKKKILDEGQMIYEQNSSNIKLISFLRIANERLGTQSRWSAVTIQNEGDAETAKSLFQKGYEFSKKSLDYMRLQHSLAPNDIKNKRRFFVAYTNLSTILVCLGKIDEAEKYVKEAEIIFNEIKSGDVHNKETDVDELALLKDKIFVLQLRGNLDEAFHLNKLAIENGKLLIEQDKDNRDIWFWLGFFYGEMLLILEKQKKEELAKRYFHNFEAFKEQFKERFKSEFKVNRFGM